MPSADTYPSLWASLCRVWRTALGVNRRNAEYLLPLNDPTRMAIVDNKVVAKAALFAADIAVAETLAVWSDRTALLAQLDEAMRWNDCVIKPGRGAGGGGIVVVNDADGVALTLIDGTRWSRDQVRDLCLDILDGVFALDEQPDVVLFERRIHADDVVYSMLTAADAAAVGGLPDIRIVLVHGVPLLAMLRVPTRKSHGRANLHAGGVGIGIDLATGRTTHGLYRNYHLPRHPDTHQPLAGHQLPHWAALLQLAVRCYDAVPLGYLGVDIVLDRARGPLVLELNARPGLQVQLANHVGLRALLDALTLHDVAHFSGAERIALGQQLYATHREWRP